MEHPSSKKIEWVLRIAIAGEFLGHGVFGLQGKADWISWIQQLTGVNADLAGKFLLTIAVLDLLIAITVLVRPVRGVLLWAALWGFWTALVRPLVGLPIWDFIERFANWGAPLALLFFLGWPKSWREWFK